MTAQLLLLAREHSPEQMEANYNGRMKTTHIERVDLEKVIGSDENNIFFIESNVKITGLHPRLLCAFESAAMHNPDKRVWNI